MTLEEAKAYNSDVAYLLLLNVNSLNHSLERLLGYSALINYLPVEDSSDKETKSASSVSLAEELTDTNYLPKSVQAKLEGLVNALENELRKTDEKVGNFSSSSVDTKPKGRL